MPTRRGNGVAKSSTSSPPPLSCRAHLTASAVTPEKHAVHPSLSEFAGARALRLPAPQTPPIETTLMTTKSNSNALKVFPRRHLLTCEGLSANEINFLLDLADKAADHIRQGGRKRDVLAGRTLIN